MWDLLKLVTKPCWKHGMFRLFGSKVALKSPILAESADLQWSHTKNEQIVTVVDC